MTQTVTDSRYLRGVTAAAEYMKVGRKQIEDWMAEGLRYVPIGREHLFRRDWLDDFADLLAERTAQPQARGSNVTRIGER